MIIVLGAFRSGTSLVSALLSALGVDFGPASSHYPPADRANPLGYFQLQAIVAANRAILRTAGVDLCDPAAPAEVTARAAPGLLDGSMLPRRAALAGYKDPRFSLTLDYWAQAGVLDYAGLRLVVLDRKVEAVAKSIVAHKEVGAYVKRDAEAAARLVRAMQAGAAWHAERAGDAMTIRYEDIVAAPEAAVARLAGFAGTRDPGAERRALALIGKERAIRRHYVRKALSPRLLVVTAAKTLRARLAG